MAGHTLRPAAGTCQRFLNPACPEVCSRFTGGPALQLRQDPQDAARDSGNGLRASRITSSRRRKPQDIDCPCLMNLRRKQIGFWNRVEPIRGYARKLAYSSTCWEWQGVRFANGYGQIKLRGRVPAPTASCGKWNTDPSHRACPSSTSATTADASTPIICSSEPIPTTCETW